MMHYEYKVGTLVNDALFKNSLKIIQISLDIHHWGGGLQYFMGGVIIK